MSSASEAVKLRSTDVDEDTRHHQDQHQADLESGKGRPQAGLLKKSEESKTA